MDSLTLVGFTPQEVETQQLEMVRWLEEKVRGVRAEQQNARALQTSLVNAGLADGRAVSVVRRFERQVQFYEKVKAALEAGYYIIAPMEARIFAVRTKHNPKVERGTRTWKTNQRGAALPVGEGDYVDPRPIREKVEMEQKILNDKPTEVAIYENTEWEPDLVFPLAVRKPEIIEATGRALKEKIFDAIGVLPQQRAGDPMVIGQIYNYKPREEPMTFFIAWWFDMRTL